MNMIKYARSIFLTILCGVAPVMANAKQVTKDKVTIDYTPLADGRIMVNYADNKSLEKIDIYIDGNGPVTLPSKSNAPINKVAGGNVKYGSPLNTKGVLWRFTGPPEPKAAEETPQFTDHAPEESGKSAKTPVEERKAGSSAAAPRNTAAGGYPMALERLNRDPFFGSEAIDAYARKADSLTMALSEAENKPQVLAGNDIEKFLGESEAELKEKKDEIPVIAQEIVVSARITDPSTQSMVLSSVIELLTNRYNQREMSFLKLRDIVDSMPTDTVRLHQSKDSIINYSIIGGIVLILLAWALVTVSRRKKKAKDGASVRPHSDPGSNNPAIVVRRRTTSILKKQSIDDVIDNPDYMVIDSSDFTPDSAVRKIYVKSSCIKDVYNMYAEDLRDSDNPKEDGCMVLGRWVHNEGSDSYDISLETVVFPGDDAVFKEYELNFGGKIKLRIAEKLRKLRRETNLQYDLVCWIHSHPGLGVFFSNSDDNVQMQLKHSQHPNFLIAFVVDILTSDQEMGIFTFRRDGSMNSKGDIVKMYSLEEMYKWALESDRASFNPDNYHNILSTAKMQMPSCKGIELNNSSIIDLTQIVVEPEAGIVGWVVGTSFEVGGNREYVVSGIVRANEKPTAGAVGVLLNVTHMSLPTIQRMIANESVNLSFAVVYSSRQNTVTSIPVINGELVTDAHFYGEETIDDLKIWTRRKR